MTIFNNKMLCLLKVNNAGEGRAANANTTEIKDLDFRYETLLKSVFMMTKLCLPYLEKIKGDLNSVGPSGHEKPVLEVVYLVVTPYQLICRLCALPLWWSEVQFVESASFLLLNHSMKIAWISKLWQYFVWNSTQQKLQDVVTYLAIL